VVTGSYSHVSRWALGGLAPPRRRNGSDTRTNPVPTDRPARVRSVSEIVLVARARSSSPATDRRVRSGGGTRSLRSPLGTTVALPAWSTSGGCNTLDRRLGEVNVVQVRDRAPVAREGSSVASYQHFLKGLVLCQHV
jgi:hypothetical protein